MLLTGFAVGVRPRGRLDLTVATGQSLGLLDNRRKAGSRRSVARSSSLSPTHPSTAQPSSRVSWIVALANRVARIGEKEYFASRIPRLPRENMANLWHIACSPAMSIPTVRASERDRRPREPDQRYRTADDGEYPDRHTAAEPPMEAT